MQTVRFPRSPGVDPQPRPAGDRPRPSSRYAAAPVPERPLAPGDATPPAPAPRSWVDQEFEELFFE